MLNYNFVVTDEAGIKYSVDMVRIKIEASSYQALFDGVLQDESLKKVTYKQSFADMQYRHFFALEYYEYGTVKMGLSINGCNREQAKAGYIEFNPNRFENCDAFWNDLKVILHNVSYADVARYDLAIDIPISRDKVMLIKDNREYACISKSSIDITEYLGQRNKCGRVKLYNKQLESELTYPLTRLEVTGTEDKLSIPVILDMRKLPKGADGVLIRTIADSPYRSLTVAALTPYMRRTILKYMTSNQILLNRQCIEQIIDYALNLCTGTRLDKLEGKGKEIKRCTSINLHRLSAELTLSTSA